MKKFVQIYHFLIRSLSAGQKFISLLLNYKVLSVQLGIVLGLFLINANYYACLNIRATTTSTLEEVINPSYLDMNSSTGSVQFNSPIKQVNITSEIQVSAAPQLQQLNISPLLQVITVPSLLRSGSDYEKTEADQPTSGEGWRFSNGTLTLVKDLAEPKTKQNLDGTWTTMWPWDHLRPQVKSVDIQSEIKVTNTSSMFAQMPQLSSISGLNNFTDKIEYMNSMFSGDSSLTSIDADQLKLDDVIQCGYMFDGCKQLNSLDVSNWNVGKVQNFSNMFAGCTNLTSIKGLDTWKSNKNAATNANATASATDMSSMFASDANLKSLDLSSFNTSKVGSFWYMFSGCSKLTSITGISNWRNSKATNMSSMFAYDGALETVDLSGFTAPVATDMSYMFVYDANLTSLDLSKFDTSKVKNFSYMFTGCTNLTSIGGLNNWNTTAATNMSYMFSSDENLTSLDLSKFDTSQVDNFSYMFAGCSKLTSIGGLNDAVNDDVNNWNTASASKMDFMFAYDANLPSLDLSKFDTSQVDNFSYMFAGCSKLTSIGGLNDAVNDDVNNWNTASASNMSFMFAYDRALNKLDLSKFDTSNVTTFNSMFYSCDKLDSIIGLSQWNTEDATDMSSMFAYDFSLKELDFSSSNQKLKPSRFNTSPSKVGNFSSMFAGCKVLKSITGLNNWDTTAATNMSSMFASADSLQKLDLSSFDTRNATQDNFFSGDTNLWYLKIGKNTQLKDDCGLPEAPKDMLFPSNQELPVKYKTSQNGKWQKGTNTVVDKTGAFCWWYPNDEMYTADEIKKYSQKDRDNGELFIWQPAFNQSKGSLVLTVSPSQINFDIILDTNNNILGNNNKSSYLAEANSDLEYTVQNPKGESWQLYAMMTKFKKKSNSDSEINSGAMSLSLNEGSENGKQHPLNQQPTSIRTSADNSLEWALKPVLNINISGLNGIPKAGSSYTTTIDYDLVNSIQ